jgi:ArsR family transcriptional regulator
MENEVCGAAEHERPALQSLVSAGTRDRASRMLAAAGDPSRLTLLELLGDRELCVSDLAALTGDSMPAVSQRLRVLRSERLVTSRRDGKHVRYRLADQHIQQLILNVLRHAAESDG